MKKIALLEAVEEDHLVFIDNQEKVRIPVKSAEISYYQDLFNQEDPVLLEVDFENRRLISPEEQQEYAAELVDETIAGSEEREEA